MENGYLTQIQVMDQQHTGKIFLGIDCGGSKTDLVLIDEAGELLAQAFGQGCNLTALGQAEVCVRLQAMVTTLVAQLPTNMNKVIDTIFIGMAGVRSGAESAEAIAVQLQGTIAKRILVENDTYIAWYAATLGAPGILIISGTGSNAYAVDECNARVQTGGWGWLLGDEGSGYSIGSQGLRQAILAIEKRGPETLLAQQLCATYAVDDIDELMERVNSVTTIAQFAPVVHRCAQAGDQVAEAILSQAANDLAVLVKRLLELGQFHQQVINVFGQGSCFKYMDLLRDKFIEQLRAVDQRLQFSLPQRSAAMGAAILAKMLAN